MARIFKQKIDKTQSEIFPLVLVITNSDWDSMNKIVSKLAETSLTHSGFYHQWISINKYNYVCCITAMHSEYVRGIVGKILGQEVKNATMFDFIRWKLKHRLF